MSLDLGALCKAWIAAGLDPARFWDVTLRLAALELAGAKARLDRERSQIWWGAMLPHLDKIPTHDQFVAGGIPETERISTFHATWDRIDASLSRHR